MFTHINANKGDFANKVLICGDPLRAKYIAETYLENYIEVCNKRGMLGYTGYYKGVRISIMSHGMGIPSAGIYTYELYNDFDVDVIIRIGTCGSITDDVKVKDIVLANDSFSISNYVYESTKDTSKIMKASEDINKIIEDEANSEGINLVKTRVLTSDNFYGESNMAEFAREKFDCGAVEMESFVIFYNAKLFNKKAACLLTVSDSQIKNDLVLSAEEREKGLNEMIVLALNSIIKIGD